MPKGGTLGTIQGREWVLKGAQKGNCRSFGKTERVRMVSVQEFWIWEGAVIWGRKVILWALGQPQKCAKLKSQLFSSSHLPRGQCLQPSNCEGISLHASPTQSYSSGLISRLLLLSCCLTHGFSSLIFRPYLTFNFFSKLSLDSTF